MNAGTSLGHYRILAPLGAGGMGEVYAAEDTKLHRRVAVKVLPEGLASDPERRKRFEREARAVAALNHPGIVTIYSVEEHDGVMFLTMELVEGQPLKNTIPKAGASMDVLMRAALGMSEALEFAHQHRIVHRDLKPANVMVMPDGRIKILDFGLAKLREVDSGPSTDESTRMMREDLTGEGRIIGTVAYMSPEQAEGKETDHRSDIFSLGVILHEMATGERPFKGDTDISTLSAILKDSAPSVAALRPDLPHDFTRVVRRCLSKDPLRRYQSAQDLHNDLEELNQDLTSGITTAPRRSSRRGAYAAAAALLLVAAAAAGGWFLYGRDRTEPQVFVADRFTRLTDSGTAFMAALSADGRYVVHVKEENNGQPGLWIRQTTTNSDVRIVPPADVRLDGIKFSPDGTFVYYVTYPLRSGVATLYKVPALGGAPLRVLEDVDSAPSFSPDGKQFSFMRGEPSKGLVNLMVAGIDGSGVRTVLAPTPPNRFPAETAPWSPDGSTIVLPERTTTDGVTRARLLAVDVATGTGTPFGGEWRVITAVDWMPDGHAVVLSGVDVEQQQEQIWHVAYPSGERRRITSGANSYSGVSVAGDGRMIATIEGQARSNIFVYAFAGGAPRQITSKTRGDLGGSLVWLPDGRIVYGDAQGEDRPQLWVMNADGSGAAQLTTGKGFAVNPAGSSDGNWIYYNGGDEASAIYRIPAAGGQPQQITPGPADVRPTVSPDGKWVYFTSNHGGRNRVWRAPAEGGTPVALTAPEAVFSMATISPDGARIVGVAWNAAKRRSNAAVMSLADGRIEFNEEVPPNSIWRPDGKSWMYSDRGPAAGVYLKPVAGGPARRIGDLQGDEVWGGGFSPDGKLVAIVRGRWLPDVVLIKSK